MGHKEKISEEWTTSGGLITQAMAAQIMNLSLGRVCAMVKKKEIRSYLPPGKTRAMVYMTDAMTYKTHENKKRFKKTLVASEEQDKYK